MTPQDVREKTFEKAVFGGYDMAEVDQFLEDVANDWAALHKENAVLKSKLKVLVEKVEEYRSTEDAMRMALLSAQKMSAEITEEAKQKSEALLAEANEEAASILKNARTELQSEEARLVEAKRASAQFLEKMRIICTKQLDFLDAVGEMKFDLGLPDPEPESGDYGGYEPYEEYDEYFEPEEAGEPEPEELDDTVRSIEDSVARLADEDAPDIDLEGELIPEDFEALPDEPEEPTRVYDFHRDLDPSELTPRPNFNFDDLRFGESYSGNENKR